MPCLQRNRTGSMRRHSQSMKCGHIRAPEEGALVSSISLDLRRVLVAGQTLFNNAVTARAEGLGVGADKAQWPVTEPSRSVFMIHTCRRSDALRGSEATCLFESFFGSRTGLDMTRL